MFFIIISHVSLHGYDRPEYLACGDAIWFARNPVRCHHDSHASVTLLFII